MQNTTKNTNKRKRKVNQLLALVLVCCMLITGAFAFLTSTDTKANIFSMGTINIKLHEDDWYDSADKIIGDVDSNGIPDFAENVVPGQTIKKAPYVENIGNNEAWVYIMVGIPTASSSELAEKELSATVTDSTPDICATTQEISVEAFAVQDAYNGKTTASEIWTEYTSDYEVHRGTEITSSTDRYEIFSLVGLNTGNFTKLKDETFKSDDGKNYYVYAYNTKLQPDASTEKLFTDVKVLDLIGDNKPIFLAYYVPSPTEEDKVAGAEISLSAEKWVQEIDGYELVNVEELPSGTTVDELYWDDSFSQYNKTFEWIDNESGNAFAVGSTIESDTCLLANWGETEITNDIPEEYICFKIYEDYAEYVGYSLDYYTEGMEPVDLVVPNKVTIPNTIPVDATNPTGDTKTPELNDVFYSEEGYHCKLCSETYEEISYVTKAMDSYWVKDSVTDEEKEKGIIPSFERSYDVKFGATAWNVRVYNKRTNEQINQAIEELNFKGYIDTNYNVYNTSDRKKLINIKDYKNYFSATTRQIGKITINSRNLYITDIDENWLKVIDYVYGMEKHNSYISIVENLQEQEDNRVKNGEIAEEDKIVYGLRINVSLGSYVDDNFNILPDKFTKYCTSPYEYIIKNIVLPDTITEIGQIESCPSDLTAYYSETSYLLDKYTSGEYSSLSFIDVNTKTALGQVYCSQNTILENVFLPFNLSTMGKGTFSFCTKLKTIYIPTTITQLPALCFYACFDLNIEIPQQLTSIGNYCFAECRSLTDINLSNHNTMLGYGAFSWCRNLETFAISKPYQVRNSGVPTDLLRECWKIKNVDLGCGKTIGRYVLSNSLAEEGTVEYLKMGAMYQPAIDGVQSETRIKENSFYKCFANNYAIEYVGTAEEFATVSSYFPDTYTITYAS